MTEIRGHCVTEAGFLAPGYGGFGKRRDLPFEIGGVLRYARPRRLYSNPTGWRDPWTVGQDRGFKTDNADILSDSDLRLQPLLEFGLSFLCLRTDVSLGDITLPVNMQLTTFLALVALARSSLAQQCYYPCGKVGTADIPCSTSSDNTHCCGKTGICLSNGYCMETSEESGPLGLYRGSCTDRN